MNRYTLSIEKVVHGGYGLARLPSAQVILVRMALPGETVIVTSMEEKKNPLFGKIVKIVQAHPARTPAPCRYYQRCGGCDLQHCNYDQQLLLKQQIIRDLLKRSKLSSLQTLAAELPLPLPSPSKLHYRQRIRLQVGKNRQLGFNAHRSHQLVEIDSCILAHERINDSLQSLRKNEHASQLLALSSQVELHVNPATGNTVVIFHFIRKVRPSDRKAAQQLCNKVAVIERIFISGQDFALQGPFHSAENEPGKTITDSYHGKGKTKGSNNSYHLSWEAGGSVR